jgi:hypothetical protein
MTVDAESFFIDLYGQAFLPFVLSLMRALRADSLPLRFGASVEGYTKCSKLTIYGHLVSPPTRPSTSC